MTKTATLRFYAELKDFLPGTQRSGHVERRFDVSGSVKDLIESCGVPHTEVDLIIVGGQSVDFSYSVRDGDCIGVYPLFESFDITPIVRVRPEPLRTIRFAADNHLGRLARFLRLLGLDTLYRNDWGDPDLVELSVSERRVLLTRDVGLLKHGLLTHGYYVRSTNAREQVKEVVRRFHLGHEISPFSRCMSCNGDLAPAERDDVADRLPRETLEHIDEFVRCLSCEKIFWRGAHYPELNRIVSAALRADPVGE